MRARGPLQKATVGSFYFRHIGTSGPGAEGFSSTESVDEEGRRKCAEDRWFQRGYNPRSVPS